MERSPNQNTSPMGRIDCAIASIDDVLASAPTSKQNSDHLAAIEGSMHDELTIDEGLGWISHEELDTILAAFHHRIHPES